MSRAQVFVLRRLGDDDLETLLRRAEEQLGYDLPLKAPGEGLPIAISKKVYDIKEISITSAGVGHGCRGLAAEARA